MPSYWPVNSVGPLTWGARRTSFRNESIELPTWADALVRGRVAARIAATARFILVVTSGFLRCEEVNAVLKLVGAHHAVADRDGLTLGGIPEHDRRRDLGLEPHAAALDRKSTRLNSSH